MRKILDQALVNHPGSKKSRGDANLRVIVTQDAHSVLVELTTEGENKVWVAEVLIEHYNGRFVALVWAEDDVGGDPTTTTVLVANPKDTVRRLRR